MQVTIWGCRGSLPTPMPRDQYERTLASILTAYRDGGSPEDVEGFLAGRPFVERSMYGGNTSCVEVTEGEHQLIFDAGSGLRLLGLKMMRGVCGKGRGEVNFFISHTHWDHIMGFPFFVPAYIPGNRLTIYGCHGGLRERFEHQQVLTHFPVTLDQMASTKSFVQIETGKAQTIGPFTITAIKNYHPGDAYSYRVQTEKGVFVYATDAEYTELPWEERQAYVEFFRGADVLVFDAAYSLVEAVEKLDWGHSSPFIGVEIANDADVKTLVLFHHDPATSDTGIAEALAKARRFYEQIPNKASHCEIVSAYDQQVLEIERC